MEHHLPMVNGLPVTPSPAGILPEALKAWDFPSYAEVLWLGKHQRWCVVIPVVNEGKRIQCLLARMKALGVHQLADIIIMDGGSTDGSLDPKQLEQLCVCSILVKTGPGGLSAQLRCGYAFALRQGYEGIVTIDGNDKDDPASIPDFIEALARGVDFIQASRFIPGGTSENTPLLRDLSIRFIHAPMLRLFSGFHWTDTTQGFRAYSSSMLLDPRIAPFREVFVQYELLAYLSYRAPRLGFSCQELPSCRRYPHGRVPTKISAIRGNFDLLRALVFSCFGKYNPKP